MTRVTGGGEAVASCGEDELETVRGLGLVRRDREGCGGGRGPSGGALTVCRTTWICFGGRADDDGGRNGGGSWPDDDDHFS